MPRNVAYHDYYVQKPPNCVHHAPMGQDRDLVSFADQYRIMASVGQDLPKFCNDMDVDLDALTKQFGIDLNIFENFEARISFDKFSRMMDTIAVIANDDLVGLKYGLFTKRGAGGPFGFGLSAAPTFHELIRFYAKYVHIVVELDIFNAIIEKDRFTLEWSYSPLVGHREQYPDFAAAAVMRIFEHFVGSPVKPMTAQLERRPPASRALHSKVFTNAIDFAQPINRFVFSSDLLEHKNPSADPTLFNYMAQQCDEISARVVRRKDIAMVLKEEFMRRIGEPDISIAGIARKFGLSERSLQRRLAERGSGFWQLYEETRDELAVRLLEQSDTPLAEVARRLGYSSPSSFSRAVKRLHGRTPGQIRMRKDQSATD